jgi:hypothetical protein
MIGSLIAAVVGKDIDRKDGEGGTAGALLGIAGWAVVKRIVPLAIIGAGILVAKHYLESSEG